MSERVNQSSLELDRVTQARLHDYSESGAITLPFSSVHPTLQGQSNPYEYVSRNNLEKEEERFEMYETPFWSFRPPSSKRHASMSSMPDVSPTDRTSLQALTSRDHFTLPVREEELDFLLQIVRFGGSQEASTIFESTTGPPTAMKPLNDDRLALEHRLFEVQSQLDNYDDALLEINLALGQVEMEKSRHSSMENRVRQEKEEMAKIVKALWTEEQQLMEEVFAATVG
ncbi:MAG: hypothetical protein Q9213_005468 [Squamulea squamosa]